MKTLKTKLLIAFIAIFSFAFANNTFLTDLPAQIKAFVNQNRTFVNKIKTNKNCINLYNVFVGIERDADKDLSADDISTRFNQAFKNDNPSGEALKHYETAYGLFSKAFKTDKVDFVNPNPQKPTEKATDPLAYETHEADIKKYRGFTKEQWEKFPDERKKSVLHSIKVAKDQDNKIKANNDTIQDLKNKIKNQ